LAVTVGTLLGRTALLGEVQRHNRVMQTSNAAAALTRLFSELIDGTDVESAGPGAFVLNTGDVGLLRSLDKLSAADASRSMNGGATIAAHGQHLRYGLSLMNRWAAEGGNPFASHQRRQWASILRVQCFDAVRDGVESRTRRRHGRDTAHGLPAAPHVRHSVGTAHGRRRAGAVVGTGELPASWPHSNRFDGRRGGAHRVAGRKAGNP
jgi:hypothetical protein